MNHIFTSQKTEKYRKIKLFSMLCCRFDSCSDKAWRQLMLNIVASFTLCVDTKTFSGLEMIDKRDEAKEHYPHWL